MKLKRLLLGVALVTLAGSSFAANVGVSVSIGQPGFYGRINLGNVPEPQVIYAEPVVIQQAPMGYARQPIYLRVPPGHEKHWNKYCRRYSACGQPVFFVQDQWYRNEYVPAYRGEHRDRDERADHGPQGDRHEGHGNNGRGHDQWQKGHGHGHD